MTIELGVLIAVCSLALSAMTFFIGTQVKARSAGINEGRVFTEIEYLKNGQIRLEKSNDEIKKMMEKYQNNNRSDLSVMRQYIDNELEKITDSVRNVNDNINRMRKDR